MLESHKYASTRVWTMDEIGITNVQKHTKIITSKGAREVGKITSGEKGKTVLAVCAMNVSGTYLLLMLIFSRKRMVSTLINNYPAGSIGECTSNGWTDSD